MSLATIITDDRRHRLQLGRGTTDRVLLFIGLNPSTASEAEDDPTIRRLLSYASRENFTGLLVGNLYTLRTKSPAVLWATPDLERNSLQAAGRLTWMLEQSKAVLCGWGAVTHKAEPRIQQVLQQLENSGLPLHCLNMNADGSPVHPLYQKKDCIFKPYSQAIANLKRSCSL